MPVIGLRLYQAAMTLAAPALDRALKQRVKRGKEEASRLDERKGIASLPRPEGMLVWLHGASVGESLVALSLAEGLTEARADLSILITSGTLTSARLVERRGVARTVHQFVPLDRPAWVKRFISNWKPDLAVFTESEIWPNLIVETQRSGTPLALVNARMNDKSLRGWLRFADTAMRVLNAFSWIGAADDRTRHGLSLLTERDIPLIGNLKLEAGLPEPAPEALAEVRATIGERPAFVAASTHAGEEALLAEAMSHLKRIHPDILMILAPRHPERSDEICAILTRSGRKLTRRSAGEVPGPDEDVWLADTLGEMALWYGAAPVALICGSFIANIGGHNPIEATRAGARVITGPHIDSFADIYAAYDKTGARQIAPPSPEAIAQCLSTALAGGPPSLQAGQAALEALPTGARAATLDALLGLIERKG
jgi:3-deoxy-D-manno-octulosonic-acid transferase